MKREFDLLRIGSPPKTVYYSLSREGHNNNYLGSVQSITGKGIKHIEPESSKERKDFNYIRRKKQPNSKRIFNFDDQLIENNKRENKKHFYPNYYTNKGSLGNDMINKNKEIIDLHPNWKSSTKNKSKNLEFHIKNCFCYNSLKDNKINNTYSHNYKLRKDIESGIINLPGGIKKKDNDIYDDLSKNEKLEKLRNKSYFNEKYRSSTDVNIYNQKHFLPIKRSFKNLSQIACLPGSNNNLNINEKPNRKKIVHENKLENVIYKSNSLFYPKTKRIFNEERKGNDYRNNHLKKPDCNIIYKKTTADEIIKEKEDLIYN